MNDWFARRGAELELVLKSADPHVVKGAEMVKHWWGPADPAKGQQEIEVEEEMKIIKGGIQSDTPELTTVRVNAIVEKIQFDVESFEVKAGKKVKLTFVNPDFMPHNLVITKPGAADAVAAAAIALGADGFKKQFLPESDDILYATKLLEKGQIEDLDFAAPSEAGDYPFICTFPGHATIMRGVMTVR